MNVAMTQLQNQLALQDTPVTQSQLDQIDKHGQKGATRMRQAGVTDELWLAAVEHLARRRQPAFEQSREGKW